MRKIYLLLVSVAMTVMANAQVDVSSKARTNQVSKARPDKASEALSAVSSSETKTNLPSGIDPNKIAGLPKSDTTVPSQPVIINGGDAKIAIVDDNMFEKKKSIDFGNNNIFNKGGGVSPNVISATTYAFTSGAGTLEDMSSGTTLLVAADLDDIASAVTPIGFDFWFDGVRNTLFSANANGLMRIGVAAVTTAFANDLASATNVPQIAPYWDDLWIGNNGKVHYKVVGSAPNRKLVVEWNNEQIPRVATATSGAGTFQAWLYESTGVIEFVYGTGIAVNATNGGYSVGIGSSATQFASVTTAGATVAYGVANNTQTGAIASGTKYTFTPNTPADPTALSFTAVGLNTMTLNWVDNATNEVGYAIFRSVDGVNYEYIRLTAANAVSSIETGLASNTTWFWRVYAVTEGTLSNALSGSQATTTGTLTGTSTVGPTGTYPSIGTAVTDINTNGLAGSLILELQATYSSAGEIFPLVINTLGSPSNTITIRPEAAAIALSITSAAIQTLDLSGATNVIIDGRAAGAGPSQLTIANTLVTGIAIRLINDASRNTIQYTTVQGVNTSATGAVILFSTTTGVTGNNSNIITNCDVRDGATTPVNCIASIGTSNTALLNTGNTVTNCNISNFHSATVASNGILVTTNTNISNTGWTISNNRVFQTASRASTATITHRGILVVGGNDYTVSNNTVGFATSGGSGTYTMTSTGATAFVGIQVQPGDGVNSIQGNTVAGISLGTTTGSLIGISITAGSANIGTITGNTIGSGTGNGSLSATSTTNAQFIVGLNISGTAAGTINAANNTIGSLTSTGSPATINPHINVVQILGGLVTFTNNSIGSTITANSIQTTTAGTAATAQQLIGMLTGTTMPLTISGNTMANLTNFGTGTSTSQVIRGIQFQTPGVSATASNGFATISQNTVHDISGANANTSTFGGIVGIAFQGTSPFGASVDQNTVYTISGTNAGAVSSNVCGITYTNTSGTATKNKIYDIRNASTGTTVTAPPMAVGLSIQALGVTSATFANNMISLGDLQTTNTQFIGIRNHFSGTTLICHYNSVHIRGTAAAGALPSYGFLRGDNGAASAIATTVNIKNNIFDNTRSGGTGKHYAIGNVNTVPATGWSATASNNNVLNSPVAGTVGIWGLLADQTFVGWQTISLGDAASLSGVPVTFVNTATGDLHANFGLTPTQLESGGVVVVTTVDYDNQTRPGPPGSINGGGTLPDIGADEFDGVPTDLTGPTITYTPLTFTCNGAINRTLTTTITDASGVPQVGIGLPVLYWRINAGAWTPVTATWVAGSTYTFSFGAGAVLADIIQYYIVAQDNVVFPSPNVSAFPSAGASGFSINPPAASTPPTTPSSYTISATLSGTYTVGTAGTYPTLTAAVAAYNTSCLGGAVVFELLDISYTTRPTGVGEVYPIIINANPDASAINTLTIRPAATVAVAITGASATSSIIKLNGADYVTIDGLNTGGASLSITNTSATVNTTTVWIGSASASDGATNNTIRNCTIKGATNITTAVAVLAGSGVVYGNAAEAANSNNTIQGNTINTAQNAIFISGLATTFDQNWSITNNIMGSAVAAEKLSFRGMLIGSVQNFTVSNNTIMGVISTAASSATMSGIQLALNVNGGTISRNIISDIKQINTLGWGSNGIYLAASSTVSDVDVYNNVIYDVASYGFADVTQADNGYGIMVQSGGGYKIRFNSVRLTTDQTDPTGITAAINISSGIATAGSLDIRDNIFANTQTIGVLYSIYCGAANTVFSNINYNDYYPGTGTLGFLGAAQGTIALWQTATGQDAFSVSVDPLFTSTTNLALLAGSPVIGAGVTIVGITTDATASTRNSPPSMGAYESKVVYAAQTFLQGAYSAGLSRHKDVTAAWAAVLNANALLQPYNTAAFGSYAGTESVTAGFFVSTGATTDVTDWVLLELRDAVTPATIITRRAAFIREDGMIVDLDGISPVSFRGFAAGSYFVVVRHRNHLGVRSAAIQLVDGSAAAPTPYNFSSAQAQAFQDGVIVTNAAMVNLTGGVFGMWGGNANPSLASAITVRASGGPTINDYLYLINTALGGDVTLIVPAVYSTADMNMDGTVRASGGPAINDYLFLINAVLSSSVLTIINQHQ